MKFYLHVALCKACVNLSFLFVKLLISLTNFRLHFHVICERTVGVTVNENSYVRKLKDFT